MDVDTLVEKIIKIKKWPKKDHCPGAIWGVRHC